MSDTPEQSASTLALRNLLQALAINAAAARHGTAEQAIETHKAVDAETSKAWSVLHEIDHTKAESPEKNFQEMRFFVKDPALVGRRP